MPEVHAYHLVPTGVSKAGGVRTIGNSPGWPPRRPPRLATHLRTSHSPPKSARCSSWPTAARRSIRRCRGTPTPATPRAHTAKGYARPSANCSRVVARTLRWLTAKAFRDRRRTSADPPSGCPLRLPRSPSRLRGSSVPLASTTSLSAFDPDFYAPSSDRSSGGHCTRVSQ